MQTRLFLVIARHIAAFARYGGQAVCIACLMSASVAVQAAGPEMQLHQVQEGENWRELARKYQLSERQLRYRYNETRFMTSLNPGDWVWLPKRATHQESSALTKAPVAIASRLAPATQAKKQPQTKSSPLNATASSRAVDLPRLGRADSKSAPRSAKLKLTLASAAQAAANDKLDKFVEQQSSSWADSTLSFGSAQLSDLLWVSPEHWSWDYQLPLFDKELLFNSRMALPLTKNLQGEVGVDYRDQRLTYQVGVNIERSVAADISAHLEPVVDYQSGWDHQRGGLLLYFSEPNWVLGAGGYQPLSGWQQQAGKTERAAAGQVVFGEGRLGWLPGLSVSSQFYQWQGKRLNLYGSGDKYKAPMSRQWSLNYAPWQVFRLQSSLLSNSKDKFETRFRIGLELPLGVKPGLWWKHRPQHSNYDNYQPLQHHQVLVLEQK